MATDETKARLTAALREIGRLTTQLEKTKSMLKESQSAHGTPTVATSHVAQTAVAAEERSAFDRKIRGLQYELQCLRQSHDGRVQSLQARLEAAEETTTAAVSAHDAARSAGTKLQQRMTEHLKEITGQLHSFQTVLSSLGVLHASPVAKLLKGLDRACARAGEALAAYPNDHHHSPPPPATTAQCESAVRSRVSPSKGPVRGPAALFSHRPGGAGGHAAAQINTASASPTRADTAHHGAASDDLGYVSGPTRGSGLGEGPMSVSSLIGPSAAETVVASLREAVAELTRDNARLQASAQSAAARVAALEAELRQAQAGSAVLTEIRAAFSAQRTTIASLEQQLVGERASGAQLRSLLTGAQAALEAAQAQRDGARQHAVELSAAITALSAMPAPAPAPAAAPVRAPAPVPAPVPARPTAEAVLSSSPQSATPYDMEGAASLNESTLRKAVRAVTRFAHVLPGGSNPNPNPAWGREYSEAEREAGQYTVLTAARRSPQRGAPPGTQASFTTTLTAARQAVERALQAHSQVQQAARESSPARGSAAGAGGSLPSPPPVDYHYHRTSASGVRYAEPIAASASPNRPTVTFAASTAPPAPPAPAGSPFSGDSLHTPPRSSSAPTGRAVDLTPVTAMVRRAVAEAQGAAAGARMDRLAHDSSFASVSSIGGEEDAGGGGRGRRRSRSEGSSGRVELARGAGMAVVAPIDSEQQEAGPPMGWSGTRSSSRASLPPSVQAAGQRTRAALQAGLASPPAWLGHAQGGGGTGSGGRRASVPLVAQAIIAPSPPQPAAPLPSSPAKSAPPPVPATSRLHMVTSYYPGQAAGQAQGRVTGAGGGPGSMAVNTSAWSSSTPVQ